MHVGMCSCASVCEFFHVLMHTCVSAGDTAIGHVCIDYIHPLLSPSSKACCKFICSSCHSYFKIPNGLYRVDCLLVYTINTFYLLHILTNIFSAQRNYF